MEEKLKQHPSDIVKVVLFGPESTGKTTLSEQLARHYNTVWVPEYAREYLQKKWDEEKKICEFEDLVPIAKGQIKLENELSKKAIKVLICDTDILETMVYSMAYFEKVDSKLEKWALKNSYECYFLTNIDVPWIEDDLRDRPEQREQMFNLFKTSLEKYHRSFVILSGNETQRFQRAIREIDKLLKK